MKRMKIGEAARRLGIHPNTLRVLEKMGLIKADRDWTGNRRFSEQDIEQIEKVLFHTKTAIGKN